MSAIMLPRLHIHCLVAAGFLPLPEGEKPHGVNKPMKFELHPGGQRKELDEGTADRIGQTLVDANLSSVIAAGCAHADCIAPEDIAPYKWPRLEDALTTPVETLKAIRCYQYQSGDHREWSGSTAERYCEQLQEHVTSQLQGYNEAGWVLLVERVAQRSGQPTTG